MGKVSVGGLQRLKLFLLMNASILMFWKKKINKTKKLGSAGRLKGGGRKDPLNLDSSLEPNMTMSDRHDQNTTKSIFRLAFSSPLISSQSQCEVS